MKITEANSVLEWYFVNRDKVDLRDTKTANKLKAARKAFVSFYSENPDEFIETFVKIIHGKTNEECPFILNDAQRSLSEAMRTNRFVAAPKARQLGITTFTNARALHHSLFARNANVLCMALNGPNAQINLKKIKTMFKSMPEWVQWNTMHWGGEKDGHYDNKSAWNFKSKITNTENSLQTESGNSEDATRGKTPTFLHWTETAFSEIAEEIFTSVFPALNKRRDSVIVLESTGNGNQGFYYEVCVKIRQGFEVVFMPWHMDSGYAEDGEELTEADLDYIQELMGVDKIPEFLSEAQLRWYKSTSEAIGKAKGQQEYPINVEQVFMATNASFFSHKAMSAVESKEPHHLLHYEQGYLARRAAGPGAVYYTVDANAEYIIVCDPTEGAHDPAVIGIYDPDGREVLLWREKMEPEQLVDLLNLLGRQWNDALIVVESNGIGQYVLRSLLQYKFYPNVYREDGKPGMRTHAGSKPEILSILHETITNKKMEFNNPYLVKEMATFNADTLRAEKGPNIHDDVVMMSAMASYIYKFHPPRYKRIEDRFVDYGYRIGETAPQKRRFII